MIRPKEEKMKAEKRKPLPWYFRVTYLILGSLGNVAMVGFSSLDNWDGLGFLPFTFLPWLGFLACIYMGIWGKEGDSVLPH